MTPIGIIGSGHVGSNLAKAAIAHGYDAVPSNSQGPDSPADLVSGLGPRASAATPAEAAAAGGFTTVVIPLAAIAQVPVERSPVAPLTWPSASSCISRRSRPRTPRTC